MAPTGFQLAMPAGAPPDPRFMKALLARRQGRTDDARQMLEDILAEEPDHQDALEVLGMLVSEQGELDRAIELTLRLAELDPTSIMAHANISRFYMLKGDKDTAEEWQSKARVLGWKEEVGRKADSAGGSGNAMDDVVDPDQLVKQEEAVAGDPKSVVARLALAKSYRKLGMPAKSVSHLKAALALDESLSILYLELGQSLEAANMLSEAMDVYRKGVPLADAKGDLMPRNQMASRLASLTKQATS